MDKAKANKSWQTKAFAVIATGAGLLTTGLALRHFWVLVHFHCLLVHILT